MHTIYCKYIYIYVYIYILYMLYIYPPLRNGLMARLWAPSWKCWASALDSQQKLPLSWHCPEACKKGLPSPGSYQNGTKICSPNPSQGGGRFPQLLARPSFVAVQNFTWFSECSKPKKWDHDHRNTSKINPKVLPKGSLKRSSNPFWKKQGGGMRRKPRNFFWPRPNLGNREVLAQPWRGGGNV